MHPCLLPEHRQHSTMLLESTLSHGYYNTIHSASSDQRACRFKRCVRSRIHLCLYFQFIVCRWQVSSVHELSVEQSLHQIWISYWRENKRVVRISSRSPRLSLNLHWPFFQWYVPKLLFSRHWRRWIQIWITKSSTILSVIWRMPCRNPSGRIIMQPSLHLRFPFHKVRFQRCSNLQLGKVLVSSLIQYRTIGSAWKWLTLDKMLMEMRDLVMLN